MRSGTSAGIFGSHNLRAQQLHRRHVNSVPCSRIVSAISNANNPASTLLLTQLIFLANLRYIVSSGLPAMEMLFVVDSVQQYRRQPLVRRHTALHVRKQRCAVNPIDQVSC